MATLIADAQMHIHVGLCAHSGYVSGDALFSSFEEGSGRCPYQRTDPLAAFLALQMLRSQ